jgi:transforming growth factor-beta-induced protein
LVAALTKEGLATDFVAVLSGDGPFTVFAPTNAAFAELLAELEASSLDDIDNATLEAVLKMHVLSGKTMAGDLTEGLSVPTLLGESLVFSLMNGAKITDPNGRVSNITGTDFEAKNGVVHVIDKVILPLLTSVDNEVLSRESVNVYPNPASSFATVEYSLTERRDVTLEIFDILGSKVTK